MGGGVAFFERWSTLAVSDCWQTQLPLLERSKMKKAFLPSAAMATRKAVSRPSPSETRISLVAALASQAFSASQRLFAELATESWRYAFPRRMAEARNLEEMLMSVPDLETVRFKTLRRTERYEIREVEPYFVAETSLRGNRGFDFSASSQGFNALASYLFGQNTMSEKMEMTMPVYVERSSQSAGEKMEMTTPVITKQSSNQGRWQMSFVLPSKYNHRLPIPKDSSVRIKAVPSKTIAVSAFSGFVTDEEVQRRESELRDAVKNDAEFQIKANSLVEVAQFNPPFMLPFMRRNEIALEVERKNVSASKFSPDISGNLSYDDTPGLP